MGHGYEGSLIMTLMNGILILVGLISWIFIWDAFFCDDHVGYGWDNRGEQPFGND